MQRDNNSNEISKNALKTPMPYGCRPEFNPQQQKFVFDELTLDSNFDAGNMALATKQTDGHYNIWVSPDCGGTNTETGHRTWFYFRVKNVSRSRSYTYTFTIKNISTQIKLFNEGLLPVYRSLPSSPEWKKIKPQPISIQATDQGLEVSFNHIFNVEDDETYFAFTYPWSYSEDQEVLNKCERELKDDPEIYFNRELLAYSLEQRRIELLTISSHTNKLDQRERVIPDLFPEKSPHDRPVKFSNKKYVFISARVHPGESPSSYSFHSFLRFLLSKTDPRAKVLRDNFVMVLIPMLNPDGVYRGHWRVDTQGLNLNRFYINPTFTEHPSIYAVKEIILDLNNSGRLFLYCDLHAHAGKKGCFVYGNSLPFKQQVEARIFAKLLSLNSQYFEYDTCSFSDQNVKLKDKSDGDDKEGAGRVALFKATNLACCYTLEFNYNSGKYRNVLTPQIENKVIQLPKGKTIEVVVRKGREEEKEAVPTFSSVNTISPEKLTYSECYTSAVFEEVGEAIGPTLLDMLEINPMTRIKSSPYKNLKTLKLHIATNLPKDSVVRVSAYINKATKNVEVGAKPKFQHANSAKGEEISEKKSLRHSKSKPQSISNKTSASKEVKRLKK